MRYATLLVAGLVIAGCDRDSAETRAYELRYVPAEAALNALHGEESGLSRDITVTMKPNSSVITLHGEPDQLERALQLLGDIDRPHPAVRFRFQLVEADGFAPADSAIADVEAVLRDLFRFRGYRVVAEAVAQAEAPGRLRQLIGVHQEAPVFVNVEVMRVISSDSATAVSMIVDLSIGNTSILSTSLTVPGGKTAVIGSAQTMQGGNTLILVVRPEIE